ncbi:MAG: class I SAM-dependent methyltransferase [Candidatus Thorarchaeota archaeon]
MQEPHLKSLRCPRCKKVLRVHETALRTSEIQEGSLTCEKGHIWPITEGIPSLVYPEISEADQKWITDYDNMAEKYDEMVLQYGDLLDVDLDEERKNFAQFMPMEGPSRILDVSLGTAANFMALSSIYGEKTGRFNLHGMDLSWGMLRVAKRKITEKNMTVNMSHSSVFNIPYVNGYFDIVLHSGGVNTFSDIPLALEEMLRVTRNGGIVIVVDEGVSPEIRSSERGKSIIKANSLFAARPPLEHIPAKAKDVELQYVMNGTFYQISFRK